VGLRVFQVPCDALVSRTPFHDPKRATTSSGKIRNCTAKAPPSTRNARATLPDAGVWWETDPLIVWLASRRR